MSVYKSKASPFWQYDFRHSGLRFHGSTKRTKRRQAERVEALIRANAEREALIPTPKTKPEINITAAAERFWQEKGRHEANADTVNYQLERLVTGFGKKTLLSGIGSSEMATYQAKARGRIGRNKKLPANRTVNAEVPELLRRVMKRAKRVWGFNTGDVGGWEAEDWRELHLPVNDERTRELTEAEEEQFFQHLRDDYKAVVLFGLISGLRRANLVGLKRTEVDLDGACINVRVKGGRMKRIPIGRAEVAILQREIGRHPIYVFTYVARKTRDGRKRSKRYPIVEGGLRRAMGDALKKAGIEDFRIHDLRHTAASRALRASKDLASVQLMMGHADISSTMRYIRVLDGDVRAVKDACESRNIPGIVKSDNSKSG